MITVLVHSVSEPPSASNAPNCVVATRPEGNRHRTLIDNWPVACAVSVVDFANRKNLILVRGAVARFPFRLSSAVSLATCLTFVQQSPGKPSNVPGVEFCERKSFGCFEVVPVFWTGR